MLAVNRPSFRGSIGRGMIRRSGVVNEAIGETAIIVQGIALNGKPCRLVDNTGTASEEILRDLLANLIRERCFGFSVSSGGGESTVSLDRPTFGHVQLDERVYRLIVRKYEARLEAF